MHNEVRSAWTIDEKWGLGFYMWYEQANTLANRDYKQPQIVIRPVRKEDVHSGTEPLGCAK